MVQVSYKQNGAKFLDDIWFNPHNPEEFIDTLTRRYGPGVTNIRVVKIYSNK